MEPTLEIGQRVLVNRFMYHFTDPGVGDIIVFHPPAGVDRAKTCGRGVDEGRKPGQPCPAPTADRSDQNFIKRIVAGPGDRVSIIRGQVVVNGELSEKANEDARLNCGRPVPPSEFEGARGDGNCSFPTPIKVPEDHYFMMGDNRAESEDSRYWGPIPRKWIIGKAFATYWPPRRIGIF